MSKLFALLFAVALLAVPAIAHAGHDHDHDDDGDDANSHVLKLGKANFDETIKKNDLILVEFFAPWCGHCKQLKPQWEQAAHELEGIAYLGAVDCTIERELCDEQNVRGFPTIKLFRNDGSVSEYSEGRRAADIVKFMKKQKAPAYTNIKGSEVASLRTGDEVAVVGFFNSVEDAEAKAFIEAATALRNDYTFAVVVGEEVAAAAATAPSVTLYKEEGTVVFSGKYEKEDLVAWVDAEAFPLVGVIGPENYQKYVDRALPLVWIFVDYKADATKNVLSVASEVAKQFKGRLSLVQLDGVRWAEHAKNYGLSGNTPGFVVENRDENKNFVFPEDKEVTVESLRAHLQGFVDGTLTPTYKSEEIPAENDGPVKVVVGKTFESIVMDETKDVLVEFYAPWCGHCKKLVPIYEKLGEKFAANKNVVVAKLDATLNDIPGVDVQGFPTIFFYPAYGKATPIQYRGDRTMEGMAEFIEENGYHFKSGSAAAEAPVEAAAPAAHDEL